MKILHRAKKWLSPKTTAFIYTYLENDDGYKYGQFKIGDCNRMISLDIDIGTKKERSATIKKLNTIAYEADRLAGAIEDMDND